MFHPDVFGDLTIDTVFQALEQGRRLKRQDSHLAELGVATLTSCVINANRDQKKGKAAKPADFFYFANSDSLDPAIAGSFFSLINDKLLPSWVVHAAPIDLLRQSKGTIHPTKNRCLIGDGVAIFCPTIEEKNIDSAFAVFNEAETGWQVVTDADSQTEYTVFILSDYDQQYCRDLNLKRRQ